jgi:hypothetical protein
MLNRNRLYIILLLACTAGYFWLYINTGNASNTTNFEVCLVKHVTGIPCPSCGTTRSITSISQGNFAQAIRLNPLGFIVSSIMIGAPLWIVFDVLTKKSSLFEFYTKAEYQLRRPFIALPLIILLLTNWIWNIIKEI